MVGRMPHPSSPLLQVACGIALLLSLATLSIAETETNHLNGSSTSEIPNHTDGTENSTSDDHLQSTKQSEAAGSSSIIALTSASPTQQPTAASPPDPAMGNGTAVPISESTAHDGSTAAKGSTAVELQSPSAGSDASTTVGGATSPTITDAGSVEGSMTSLAVSSSAVINTGLQTLVGNAGAPGSAATHRSSTQPAGDPAAGSSVDQTGSTSMAEPRSVPADVSADGALPTLHPPPSDRASQCQERKCLNGGTCWSTSPGYICTCSQGYEGTYCGAWTGERYEDLKIALLAVSVATGVIILFLVVALAVVCCTRKTHKEQSAERPESGLYGDSQIHSWFPSLPRPSIKPSVYGEVSVEMNENLRRRQQATDEQAQVISTKSTSVKDGGHFTEGVANDGFTPDDIAKASNAPPAVVSHEEPRTTMPVTFGPVSVVTIASTIPRSAASSTSRPVVPEETTNSSTIPRAVNSAVSPASVSDVRPSLRVSAPAGALNGGSGNRDPPLNKRRDLVYF